jgi:hypothetical protein
MNARERQDFNRELRAYKEMDKVAYARIMKACRLNPKTKNLCETGNLKTANEILVRLRQRFHTIDDMVKASHLLRYPNLKQNEGESGADFVDREQKEFLALREKGINVDDSLRLTKFIQQDTTHSKHKSLAQTIFTTPNMTLSRATSLFETYHPPLPLKHLLSTHSFAGTARKRATTFSPVIKRERKIRRKRRNPNAHNTRIRSPLAHPGRSSAIPVLSVMPLIIFLTSVLARKKSDSV